MSDVLRPETTQELTAAIQSADRVLPVGAMTKSALCSEAAWPEGTAATLISLRSLSGMIQYEPSEFTFTAWAGTPLAEVQEQLAQRNQYLPFDPLLARQGATLGGTVAAGISGPGRVRYGGLRDFLLGVRLLCGDAGVVNTGGKVVKNAAGFDIPKLLVGSLGRLGVMTELTFKVFPKAAAMQTYRLVCESDAEAISRISLAATSRWELDAIDYRSSGHAAAPDRSLYLRIGGPEAAITAIGKEMGSVLRGDAELLEPDHADEFWKSVADLDWPRATEATVLAKVPITPAVFVDLSRRIAHQPGISTHLSAAGGLLWVAIDPQILAPFSDELSALNLSGLVLRGRCDSVWLGKAESSPMAAAIKRAMDPIDKFPAFQFPVLQTNP